MSSLEYDYVVVGSGAGGGTVAARLAEEGASVVVLEAGGDARDLFGCDAVQPEENALPYDYDVPGFHVRACENDAIKWEFFVRHYSDDDEQGRDPNYRLVVNGERVDGVLYPRAGTLGGCTAHNAMIFVYPHNEDWAGIAELTGDPSWLPENMRSYFERLERCAYRADQWWLRLIGRNPSRHGFGGWLNVELPRVSAKTFFDVLEPMWPELEREFSLDREKIAKLEWLAEAGLDANDWRLVSQDSSGLRSVPMTTKNHRRTGTRERLLDVQRRHSDRLKIELNALATQVLFDDANRAIGVQYLRGKDLYRAGRRGDDAGVLQSVRARREVILAGGAFNTPQLLMLSGIGPAEHLRDFEIDVRAVLPVGRNLQDRYEVAVVNRMREPWRFYQDASFSPGDPQFREWDTTSPSGVYTTNGSALAFAQSSSVAEGPPDLFLVSLLAGFTGYYPGFSRDNTLDFDRLTWVVLKAHTRNRRGTVTLRSRDPRDTPLINFNYFAEGGDDDLRAVIEGVKYVRQLGDPLRRNDTMSEIEPGPAVDTDEKLGSYIRSHAWGHHASCTCPIGDKDAGGVLSSDFRVHGVSGLRVVDASVFPRIPGFFIASATYMIAEKAADVILAANRAPRTA